MHGTWDDEQHRFDDEAHAEESDARIEATLHAQPDYKDRLDALLFPCGADATRAGGRVAWEHANINCAGCLAELERRSEARRISVRANELWLAMSFEEREAFMASREDWHSELYRRAKARGK